MNSVVCEHNLVHEFEEHECDGCCARYILKPLNQKKEDNE